MISPSSLSHSPASPIEEKLDPLLPDPLSHDIESLSDAIVYDGGFESPLAPLERDIIIGCPILGDLVDPPELFDDLLIDGISLRLFHKVPPGLISIHILAYFDQ